VDPRAGLGYVEKRKVLTLQGLELRTLGRPAHGEYLIFSLCCFFVPLFSPVFLRLFLYILSFSVPLTTACFFPVLFIYIFPLHDSFFIFSLFSFNLVTLFMLFSFCLCQYFVCVSRDNY
jgi:hypothetical protein